MRPQGEGAIVSRQRFLGAMQFVQGGAPVGVGFGVIRAEGQRAVLTCKCFVQPFQFAQRVTAMAMRLGEVWPLRQRALAARQRLLETLQSQSTSPRLEYASAKSGRSAIARS